MASINFKMNNLEITLSGVNGYMEVCTYTNLDPIDYVFKAVNVRTKEALIYRCHANNLTPVPMEGFRRMKTDEVELSFLGATAPS